MASAEAKTLLPAFLDFVKTLHGDEKSEAQTFLDRLFKALGHAGVFTDAVQRGIMSAGV